MPPHAPPHSGSRKEQAALFACRPRRTQLLTHCRGDAAVSSQGLSCSSPDSKTERGLTSGLVEEVAEEDASSEGNR
jgi:hypothetical protein